MSNLATTTSTKSREVEAEVGAGIRVDPVVSTSMQSLNEINEHILKLCVAAQNTSVGTTALTAATSTAPLTAATQDSPFLPLQVPVVGANGYTGQSSGTSLISPQLQSLLALQFVTSQLHLAESCSRLPILSNPSSNVSPDIRWKPVYETQSSALPSVPAVDSTKSTTDMRQNVVVNDGGFSSKRAPISSTIDSDVPTCTISKTGIVFE